MGIPSKPVTARWSESHLEILRRIGESFDPPSQEHSFIVRTVVTGLWAYLTTDKMPRWMRELQSVLGRTSCTDSPAGLGLAGDSAGRALGEAPKRPPRRIVSRPKDRGAVAAVEVVAGGAWLAPFCERKPFAYLSQGV